MFHKFEASQRIHKGENNQLMVIDVREDEDQTTKLHEIIDLLVAAGYFRARIKGILPFDKVVGGMTWCIQSCNVDVAVELLYQENLTIRQKIALTEKIVAVLPKLRCPYTIEPHQIQGLDFIHIFPVIQWLVKRSLEFRQTISNFVRCYAVDQFNKYFNYTLLDTSPSSELKIVKHINIVKDIYLPRRCYKCTNAAPSEVFAQVQITLAEYGNISGPGDNAVESDTHETVDHDIMDEEDFKTLVEHYTSLQLEFQSGAARFLKEKQVSTIEEDIAKLSRQSTELNRMKSSLEDTFRNVALQIKEMKSKQLETFAKLDKLLEGGINKAGNMEEVEELLLLNENLNAQDSHFKAHCKQEMVRLQGFIKGAKNWKLNNEVELDLSKSDREMSMNLGVVRLHLAKKNRTVAALLRQEDEVLKRPELAQYQRRFLELYNQMSAKHKETKQYYTLYNTIEDMKIYMKKELALLNSISDSYPETVLSACAKLEFLNQLQNIIDGVKQSKNKVEKKITDDRRQRESFNSLLQILVEQQRKYASAVRQLSIECKTHELLLHKFQC